MKRIILITCFFLHCFHVHAQEPCKTAPFSGYSGNCDVSVMTSVDGKHFYTSDGTALKIWDMKTMKVVDEHPDFPYKLVGPGNNEDVILVQSRGVSKFYSISSKSTVTLNHDPLAGKNVKFSKKQMVVGRAPTPVAFDPVANIVLVKTGTNPYGITASQDILKVDLNNNNTVSLVYTAKGAVSHLVYDPALAWLALKDDDGIKVIDMKTGAEVAKFRDDFIAGISYFASSPGDKYIALVGDREAHIFEKASGKYLGTTSGKGNGVSSQVFWKSNGEGFYFAASGSCTHNANCFNQLGEYALPGVKLVMNHVDPATNPYGQFYNFILDADGGNVYISPYNRPKKYEFIGYNLADKKEANTLALAYTQSADMVRQEADEKVQRMRNFNQMIDRIFELAKPASHHQYGEPLIPQGVTTSGDVLIREFEQLFHWRIPDGKPQGVYISKNSPRQEGIGAGRIPIAGPVGGGFISPSGKEVGIAYSGSVTGFEIFREGKSMFRDNKRDLIALLDGKALAYTPGKTSWILENVELIETTTGNVLKAFGKVQSRYVDATTVAGKIFMVDDKITVMDVNALSLTSYPLEEAQKIGFYIPVGIAAPDAIKNKSYTGMKRGEGVAQGRYYITAHADDGFNIYDLVERKNINPKPLYISWKEWEKMAYLPGTQQLLVWWRGAGYARPNAKDDEPGASAYTINIKTGAITPYLMHTDRATMIAANKKADAIWKAFEADVCAFAEFQLPKGAMFTEKNGERVLKIGVDCEDSSHIMARQKPTNPDKTVFTTSFEKWEFGKKKYSDYSSVKYRLCYECGGFPEKTIVTRTSGWSDWEQVNFNVYSRVYQKNKKEVTVKICNSCNGSGIVSR